MSCVRRSCTWIRCQPNGERTGADISPGFSLFIACSKSGTVSPGEIQPRSPPFAALAVLGVELRLLVELRAEVDALLDALDLDLRLGFRRDLVDLDQDVPRVRLLDDRRRVAAARLEQLDDVEAARRAQHAGDLARLHRPRTGSANTVGSRAGARQPRLPPCSASRRVGESRRDLRRNRCPPRICFSASSARAPLRLDLLGRRLLGHDHEDVRQPVLDVAAGLRVHASRGSCRPRRR